MFESSVRGLAGVLACSLVACGREPPRGQALVFVDIDLPVTGQVSERPEIGDAAIDALRVDVLAANGAPGSTFLVVAPDPRDWPVSFGIASDGQSTIRLRLRAFRASRAKSGYVGEAAILDPPTDLAVDRLIDIALPDSDVDRFAVVLRGDCLGLPASPNTGTACVDATHPSDPAASGVERRESKLLSSEVGTWSLPNPKPCTGTPPGDAICIPGGFSLVGEDDLVGVAGDSVTPFDSGPARPVFSSPFFFDRTEYSVGRLRALLAQNPNALSTPLPATPSFNERCTWAPESADDLPLNCVYWDTARQLCQIDGGDLPSEARWEHAARGHGRGNAFPWGSADGECCTTQVGSGNCAIEGAGPVAAHANGSCGTHDRSVDGVLDLGGNVREFTLDVPVAYDHEFWSTPGIFRDPVFTAGDSTAITRGGSFNDSLELARASFRRIFSRSGPASVVGFRCAYADVSP